eukprot:CAMPEP_0195652412 /NCGR_PEP_ID=MMETSP0815-20121206/32823_1 /TAXON_ID=97485 /ORGANISM="Prymnesium parvum, Strain Texoma1" /LENGTH=48 /DNA_ID= /DNA_START= /DNA_END= /DNA_ORIENTATION=
MSRRSRVCLCRSRSSSAFFSLFSQGIALVAKLLRRGASLVDEQRARLA